MNDIRIIIPALQSLCVFNNDLLIKVSGKTVIEHLLDKCKLLASLENIFVITDSEEVELLCTRREITVVYSEMDINVGFDIDGLNVINEMIGSWNGDIAMLSPYSLFFEIEHLLEARVSLNEGVYIRPALEIDSEVYVQTNESITDRSCFGEDYLKIINSFVLARPHKVFVKNYTQKIVVLDNLIDFELKSRHDLWVYERLINRKKIVFRVAASKEIGMGHVYRALSLAHEIIEHEVVFVCDDSSSLAVKALSMHEYPVYVSPKVTIEDCIKSLDPMLVINDFLDTELSYIEGLRDDGIRTINFEDFGSGASISDLTINDLYDEPVYFSENTLWGYQYFFVRDEFYSAIKIPVESEVEGVLLTFGGTDQNNFTQKFYNTVKSICKLKSIKIFVVTGEGYSHLASFEKEIIAESASEIECIHKTGVMSKIMEKVQVAISSNGRTVYELAHMNIPTIVVSHHERESHHKFSCSDNGFVNLGCYEEGTTESRLLSEFSRIISDDAYRKRLASSMEKFSFVENKKKINNIISSLINK